MFISNRPDNYEKVYQELLQRLARHDLAGAAAALGLEREGETVRVPCLGRDYLVDARGVRCADGSPAPLTHRIVLAYYLLHGGRGEPALRFLPYRELPGGQDFARSLSGMVEGRLARFFSGKLALLEQAVALRGGRPEQVESSVDGAWVFPALPRVPLLLTFYDADEEFPAEAKLFYDLTAPNFLDLECLAVLGLMLVLELEGGAQPGQKQ